ncbi:hypothetical protein EW145_g6365 [Phellinidium pouzarii]|uniref:GAT domain-containing protein n=1 Tax=Phellinidium pouzarii TaxID=167371 RepID=A0A4S4L1I2_9AGAM|nr:hypothetical protein EW145_g6365 [Phellinidium pouzarii]
MDDCSLRPASLETLAQNVRTSSLRNISLRHNRISASGAVALALMIKDYPDTMPAYTIPSNSSSSSSSPSSISNSLFRASRRSLIPLPRLGRTYCRPPPRQGPVPPPPVHPANAPVQTTYTPYIPRARRAAATTTGATATARAVQHAARAPDPLSATGQHVPIITSSAQGGVTTRHPVSLGTHVPVPKEHTINGPSAALLDKTGIQYIAQVLKRNRTLKVLNLSENKIDVQGLIAVAEALKYNLTLETLDLSRNPCSGPSLEGIQSLRTAFTLNTSLKRLFLSSTLLSSTGAIALAEFLPESTSLLHLDLTLNTLDLAGVMALSGGLKANHTMRCLDLNIPPDDEEFARMCRDILGTCVRNTEEAERNSHVAESGRGLGKGVWGMIEESELAKTFKKDGEKKAMHNAKECQTQLQKWNEQYPFSPSEPSEGPAVELVDRSKAALLVLSDIIQTTTDPIRIEELLFLNDSITQALAVIDEARKGATPITNGNSAYAASYPQASVDARTDHVVPSETEDAWMTTQAAKLDTKLNGLRLHIPSQSEETEKIGEGADVEAEADADVEFGAPGTPGTPGTPRIDKGKGRAEPEPVVHEKVLSPSFVLTDSDSEDEGRKAVFVSEPEEGPLPIDLSKVMVEEEGEVFRKGAILLGPEEMDGEYDGEELRIELLEAKVERPPPRALNLDEFGMELPPLPNSPSSELLSPTSPHEPSRSSPRPYLRNLRSSSSTSLQGSPTLLSPGRSESTIKGMQSPMDSSPLSPAQGQSPGGTMPYLTRRRVVIFELVSRTLITR